MISQEYVKVACRSKYNRERGTWDEIAKAIGVSRASAYKFLVYPDHKTDFDNLAKFAKWAGLPLNDFVCEAGEGTLKGIYRAIMGDHSLSLKAKRAIYDLMRLAYYEAIGREKEKVR